MTLYSKLEKELPLWPIADEQDLVLIISLEYFMQLLHKHIDLVDRRIIKGETIPHEEKMFSIFVTYTEWVKKGMSRLSVELGKKLAITTDQFDLIVDYQNDGVFLETLNKHHLKKLSCCECFNNSFKSSRRWFEFCTSGVAETTIQGEQT